MKLEQNDYTRILYRNIVLLLVLALSLGYFYATASLTHRSPKEQIEILDKEIILSDSKTKEWEAEYKAMVELNKGTAIELAK